MATGSQQRKAGDDLSALGSFLRAHALGPTPESFAQIGSCEYALNRFVEAEIHLAEAMKFPTDPWIRKNHVALEEYVASTKAMLGWLEVVGTPAGADVEVGGRPVGHLPLPGRIRVAAGEVNIRMDAPGFKVNRQDVEVTADQVRRVNIDLVPMNSSEPSSKAAQAKIGQPGSRRRATPPSAIDGDVTAGPGPSGGGSSASPYRTAGWVTAGAGAVLLAAGVAALVIRESSTQEFNDYKKTDPTRRCNEALKDKGGTDCSTLLDRSHTAKIIGYSAIAGAALAGIVSVILLSANPAEDAVAQLAPGASSEASRKLARSTSPRLRCAPSLLQLGGACAMTF